MNSQPGVLTATKWIYFFFRGLGTEPLFPYWLCSSLYEFPINEHARWNQAACIIRTYLYLELLCSERPLFLGTVLCKHGGMEGEIREQVMEGRRIVSMDVKRGLRNSILLPTLTYGSKNWTWNKVHQSRVLAVEMSYLRGVCAVSRWNGLSNKNVYRRCGMRGRGSRVGCSVVEWVKRSTLRWFSHIRRMENEEFVKKVYLSSVDGKIGWRSMWVRGEWGEIGFSGQGGSVWIGRGQDPSAMATPFGDTSGGSEALELMIDWLTLMKWSCEL